MTETDSSSSLGSAGSPYFDFDALYCGESPADGVAPVSEATLRDVLGAVGWDIESLEPATLPGELDGAPVQMAFWYLRAQRRQVA